MRAHVRSTNMNATYERHSVEMMRKGRKHTHNLTVAHSDSKVFMIICGTLVTVNLETVHLTTIVDFVTVLGASIAKLASNPLNINPPTSKLRRSGKFFLKENLHFKRFPSKQPLFIQRGKSRYIAYFACKVNLLLCTFVSTVHGSLSKSRAQ